MHRINQLVLTFLPYNGIIRSWLDIGTGNGSVAQNMRDYVSIPRKVSMDAGQFPDDLDGQLYGFFLDPSWEKIQKNYKEEEDEWNETFDLITLFDVIQYYDKRSGEELLNHLDIVARRLIIIWTPEGLYPHEGHVSGWTSDEFLKRGYCVYRAEGFHQGPPQVGNGILAWKNPEWESIYI